MASAALLPPGWPAVTTTYGGTVVLQRGWLCLGIAAALAVRAVRAAAAVRTAWAGAPHAVAHAAGGRWRGALIVAVHGAAAAAFIAGCCGCAAGAAAAVSAAGAAGTPLPAYVWVVTAAAAAAACGVAAGLRATAATPPLPWSADTALLALLSAALAHSGGVRLAGDAGSLPLARADVAAATGWLVAGLLEAAAYLATERAPAPATRHTCLRRAWTFSDLNALFDTGAVRQLTLDDVPPLPPAAATQPAADAFAAGFTAAAAGGGSVLLRVLWRCYGNVWLALGLLQAASVALSFCGPLCLSGLLDYLAAPAASGGAAPWRGVLWAAVMVAGAAASAVVSTQFSATALGVQTRLRAGVLARVFSAMLARGGAARGGVTAGRITNFVSVDVQKLQDAVTSTHQLWSLPVQVAVTLYLLYLQVQFAFLAGLAVLAAFVPLNMVVSKRIGALTGLMMTARDARVQRTGELLAGIRAVKMQAWEVPLLQRIAVARSTEVAHLAARKYLDAVCVFLWAATPVLVSLATFATVVTLVPHTPGAPALSPATVFTTVSLLGLLIFPLNAFSWVVTGVLEARVSLARLDAFVAQQPRRAAPPVTTLLASPTLPPLPVEVPLVTSHTLPPHVALALRGTFRFPAADGEPGDAPRAAAAPFELRLPVPLQVAAAGVTLVVGSVGAGKSALLRAALGDMTAAASGAGGDDGDAAVAIAPGVTLAYAAQAPWVRGATVRHNIVGGAHFDAARYRRVLAATALDVDLRTMAAGDDTHVTSATLSGGQAARLGLARALYCRSTLLAADDVTAACDAAVGAALLRRIFAPLPSTPLSPGAPAATWDDVDAGRAGFLAADGNRGALLASHDARALPLAATLVVVGGGEVRYVGAPAHCPPLTLAAAGMAAASSVAGGRGVAGAADDDAAAAAATSAAVPAAACDSDAGGAASQPPEEARVAGRVAAAVVRAYLAAAGVGLAVTVAASLTAMQLSKNGSDWFLSVWAAVDTGSVTTAAADAGLVARLAGWSDTSLLAVFGAIAAANVAATALRSWSFAAAGLAACRSIHDRLLAAVAYAPAAFHDAVPTGRLLNRLSTDQYSTDETLPFQANILLAQSWGLAGTLLVLAYATSGAFLAAVPLLAVVYRRLQARYRATSRELKRLDSVTRSPLFSHLTDCLAGAATLRAHSVQRPPSDAAAAVEQRAFLLLLDASQRTWMASGLAGQWLSLRLQAVGAGVLAAVCTFAVALRLYTDGASAACGDDAAPCVGGGSTATGGSVAASAGLALAYGIPIVGTLQGLLGAFTETEKEAVAVERAMEYIDTPPEGAEGAEGADAPAARRSDGAPRERGTKVIAATHLPLRDAARPLLSLNADADADGDGDERGGATLRLAALPAWVSRRDPRGAALQFSHVSVQYATMARPAVRDVSFSVAPGECVGVAGRTGSGKSTLLAALWRLTPLSGGTVTLDGVDIARQPLAALRSTLAIVPQTPLLVAGSVRFNLDARHERTDDELAAAVAACALPPAVAHLDAGVESGGANLSVGERQLLSVCRAVAQGARLAAVDEAAAAADGATEARIAHLLSAATLHATVIVIAHRVATLAACDRVIILDAGAVVEVGAPAALAADPASHYAALVRAAAVQ